MPDLRGCLAVLAALATLGLAVPAEAGVPSRVQDAPDGALGKTLDRAQEAVDELKAAAERAIVLGGAVVYQNRHAIAGAALGCAVGSAVGATSAAALAPATGGATLAGAGYAALIGCGAGAAVGAEMGYPLDHVFEEE